MPIFFEEAITSKAVAKSFNKLAGNLYKKRVDNFISSKNSHRLRHGGTWVQSVNDHRDESTMKHHSAAFEIKNDDVLLGDIQVLCRALMEISQKMGDQFIRSVYQTVSDACDQSGNVVSVGPNGSVREALLKMFETIEFGVNETGEVALPEIHMGPGGLEKFKTAIEEGGEPFRSQIEEVKQRKISAALQAEADRKAKFLGYGEN